MADDSAVAMMQAKNEGETQKILQAAIDYLKTPTRKIASVGFSAGAVDAMKVNLLAPEIFSASILVYGGGYDQIDKAKLNQLSSPVLAITGALDKGALDAAQNFLATQKNKQFNLHVIAGADHGYAQPMFNHGRNYDYEATRVTWLLIEDFLRRNLN
jgi:dienelactone hydrolase